MRPRLLYLSALPLSTGGIEQHLLYLLEAVRSKYSVYLLAPALPEFYERILPYGVEFQHWYVDGFSDLRALYNLWIALRSIRPDIVHIQDARAGFLARLLLRVLDIPIVYTIHLPSYLYWREGLFVKEFFNHLYAIVESILNHLATDKVIYIGRLTYEEALKRRLVSLKTAVLIENGIDLEPFRFQQESKSTGQKHKIDLSPKVPVICSVSRLTLQKNPSLLLEAAALLKKRGLNFRLWFVGDGPEREKMERLTDELFLNDRVLFWGSRSDIPELLAASDIFALLSRYEGGRSLALMEAQASGKPCLVTDVGDNRLMVEDGVHGFVVPVDDLNCVVDGLCRLIENPVMRKKMGVACRERAFAHYDVNIMVKRVLDTYENLISRKTLK